jgi:hypothetical protein
VSLQGCAFIRATALAHFSSVLANQLTTCHINLAAADILLPWHHAALPSVLSNNVDLHGFAARQQVAPLYRLNPFLQHKISIRLTMFAGCHRGVVSICLGFFSQIAGKPGL